MRKMFRYRIFPSKKQQTKLNETLEEYRWLYNHLLEKRKDTYEHTGKGLSLYQQQATFPMLKQEHPSLDAVHSQVLQNVAVRVDLAFKAFFRRCKSCDNPGYPRFKGKGRYDSFTFPQSGFALLDLLPQHMIGQPLLFQGCADTPTILDTIPCSAP